MAEKRRIARALRRLRRRFARLPRWVRAGFCVLAILIVLPYLLVPVFAVVNPPGSMLMLWRLLEGRGIDHRWVDLEDISPTLPATVIMTEDGRFCAHYGVDWGAVRAAITELGEGGDARGASTIAMQTAKNLFLWPHRSYVRKVLEVPLAYWLDLVWSKRRIIEVYLNLVEWGPGVYGAEAAARRHFNVPASRLTWYQSALLAAALPNPVERSAGRPGRTMRALAARALERGQRAGAYIDCIR